MTKTNSHPKQHLLEEFYKVIKNNNLDGYIIPSTDEYQSEYSAPYAKRLAYLTNFTGSNGIAIILPGNILLFTDGRYLLQAEKELSGTPYKIIDLQFIKDLLWQQYLPPKAIIGYDPKLFIPKQLQIFKELTLKPVIPNLVDKIWHDQPPRPQSKLLPYTFEYSGIDFRVKLEYCYQELMQEQADYLLITDPISLCWLLNVRAQDLEHTPIMLGYGVIVKHQIYLFVNNPLKLLEDKRQEWQNTVIVSHESTLDNFLQNLRSSIIIDPLSCSIHLLAQIKHLKIIEKPNPCLLLKACKNSQELYWAKEKHIEDGTAICEFFTWLFTKASQDINLTEYDLAVQLRNYRQKRLDYISDSFPTICGYQENGAVVHYRPSPENSKIIKDTGLLLIDSGAQYLGCTTDITRTVNIGPPTYEQKLRYTQVLKGHIALANSNFPRGTTGANLDALARQFLWQDSLDYPHGTGHGVGSFLSVHEGPQSINKYNNTILTGGMILSNEPGYYKKDSYGIRIENLCCIKPSNVEGFLCFEQLTLVPYCKELIIKELITDSELEYLKNYYNVINLKIMPNLTSPAQIWLQQELSWVLEQYH